MYVPKFFGLPIQNIIYCTRIPFSAKLEQIKRHKSIVSHNPKKRIQQMLGSFQFDHKLKKLNVH
uniref:Uncharacterized protein n=1 Tax=Meloidogyne incognita TaxID=6306 RepID=A0A914MUM0_MELIC